MKPLNELTLLEALDGLRAKRFTSFELTQACLDRIHAVDDQLHAFLTLNDHALDEAKAADPHLPLGGVPIAIKDNFLTKGLRTTASANVLTDFIPPFDSTVVAKLKAAGAVILGKTNMDAWAHGSSTETSDFGPTRNPWDPEYIPGGSSGGSAAAVAAHECIAAIGSETAGSVRGPAAFCGITGLKPTYGRISRYGVVAMASSTDSPGPMTKTVADAAYLLNVLAGPDPYDGTTIPEPFALQKLSDTLKGVRIGLAVDYLLPHMDGQTKQTVLDAAAVLESLGAAITEVRLLNPEYAIGVYTILQRSEVSSNLARYDGIRYGQPRPAFSYEAKKRMLLGTYSLSTGYYDQYYQKAQKVRTLIVEDYQRAFSKFDAVIGPVNPGPAIKIGAAAGDPMFGEMMDVLVEASSIAGLTGTSLPCGFVNHLPVGLQVTGPQKAENAVLRVSQAYQTATDWHIRKPNL